MFEENDHLYPAKPELIKPDQGSRLTKMLLSIVLFFGLFLLLSPSNYILGLEVLLILLVHEAGHLIMLRFFGYKSLSMYFIPLLGAMVSGQKIDISQKQRFWISIMGPMPGILIGAGIYLSAALYQADILWIELGLLLMAINLVNMIPFDPLDGGNILEALYFPTNEKSKMYFTLLSSLAMIGVGVYLGFYPILIFGFLMAFKVRAFQRNRVVHDDLDELEINYRKPYHELSDREYWTLRRVFLENNPKIKDIIPDDGSVWENERLLVEQVNQLLCVNVKEDLSRFKKYMLTGFFLLIFVIPISIVYWFREPLKSICRMSDFKLGDLVAVLNEPIYGEIIDCSKRKFRIKDSFGFERDYLPQQLVPVKDIDQYRVNAVPNKEELKLQKITKKSDKKKAISSSNLPEIDLHFEALADKTNIKDLNQILQKQITACKSFVQKSLRKGHRKIVLIHGKGEGILKAEIHLYLNRLEKEQGIKVVYRDADATEYGQGGATEVLFIE